MKRIEAFRRTRYPENQTQMRSFLNFCNMYRGFVHHFAHIAAPLNATLKKGQPYVLSKAFEEQLSSFHKLREILLNYPVLRIPHPSKTYLLDCDASDTQMGCSLLQEQEDGLYMPVGYFSKSMNASKKAYSATHKEGLAVIWAIQLLRLYIEGTHFKVRIDHHALRWPLTLRSPEGRLARWRLLLAEFDFEIVYRSGSSNYMADALSRLPSESEKDIKIE